MDLKHELQQLEQESIPYVERSGFRIYQDGIELAGPTTNSAVAELASELVGRHKQIRWFIGDFLNICQDAFGEAASQIEHDFGYVYFDTAAMKRVSRLFPRGERNLDVAWKTHYKIASRKDRAGLLKKIAKEHWDREQVEEHLAKVSGKQTKAARRKAMEEVSVRNNSSRKIHVRVFHYNDMLEEFPLFQGEDRQVHKERTEIAIED